MNVSPLIQLRPLYRQLRDFSTALQRPKSPLFTLMFFCAALLFCTVSCTGSSTGSSTGSQNEGEGIASVGSERKTTDKDMERVIPADEFTLPSLSGGEKSLSDYRGKLVLLNFWATWCAPCVAEMPSLERLHGIYKDKGLEVVSISVDPPTAKKDLEDFVKKYGLTFEVLLDSDISLPPSYGVTGFPETFFIGPDGNLAPFYDPNTKTEAFKVVSDRPWDSRIYLDAIKELLDRELSSNSPGK